MKEIYDEFLKLIDGKRIMKHTEELWHREFGQTSESQRKAAEYVHELMIAEGIPNAELNFFPADGETVYHDCIMPLGWKASTGKLTLLPVAGYGEEVIADYQSHPFSLVKGSVSTPPGGKIVRIVTEQQFLAGHDVKDCLVLLEPFTRVVMGNTLGTVLDRGAIGYITDAIGNRYKYPDAIGWRNAATENNGWHVFAHERDFICFSVSPRTGDVIRCRANAGALIARIESDAQRYVAEIPVATALIPGQREEEILVFGHMFEPLSNDDCHGVCAGIETARIIMQKGTPEFSIRLAFTMELYGYTAYFASRGNFLGNEIVGACNFDVSRCVKDSKVHCLPSSFGSPFYGNYIQEQLINELADAMSFTLKNPRYFDDSAYNDSTIGIGTVWPMGEFDFAHSSIQTMEVIDEATYVKGTAFNAAIVYAAANPKMEYLDQALKISLRHLEVEREKLLTNSYGSDATRFAHGFEYEQRNIESFRCFLDQDSVSAVAQTLRKRYDKRSVGLSKNDPEANEKWRKYASQIVMKRKTTGLPHNLAKLPKEKRCRLPEGIIYGNLSNMLSNMDGKKDLATLLRESEYEYQPVNAKTAEKYIKSLNFLADSGYLEVLKRPEITEEEIVATLQKLGIAEGDTLLVHSSTSNCGYIQGGTATVIRSLQKAVSASGTLLFPTFTQPYIYLGGLNTNWNFRPYDKSDMKQIVTGVIPQTALTEFHALRSAHITHSWAGIGKNAEFCLASHGKYAPPCDLSTSPLGKALEKGAKILHFASPVATTTFIHMIEDVCNVPFLNTAVCQERLPDRGIKTVAIEKHLPGHRDFYCGFQAQECKFFTAARAAGLELRKVSLGLGELCMMDATQLFKIGKRLVEKDFRILLCDNPSCMFCSQYK